LSNKISNNFLVEGKKGAREGSELAFLTFSLSRREKFDPSEHNLLAHHCTLFRVK
jgi:hypothetical protein